MINTIVQICVGICSVVGLVISIINSLSIRQEENTPNILTERQGINNLQECKSFCFSNCDESGKYNYEIIDEKIIIEKTDVTFVGFLINDQPHFCNDQTKLIKGVKFKIPYMHFKSDFNINELNILLIFENLKKKFFSYAVRVEAVPIKKESYILKFLSIDEPQKIKKKKISAYQKSINEYIRNVNFDNALDW